MKIEEFVNILAILFPELEIVYDMKYIGIAHYTFKYGNMHRYEIYLIHHDSSFTQAAHDYVIAEIIHRDILLFFDTLGYYKYLTIRNKVTGEYGPITYQKPLRKILNENLRLSP